MSIEEWLRVASAADDEELREWILTGVRNGKPFTPYLPTVPIPATPAAVLDFGCGLGRNFPYLKTICGRVVGFDLAPMIARCRTLPASAAVELFDDWTTIRGQRFDLIFASLVLQHIAPDGSAAFLADFSRMAPFVYVLTRSMSDDGVDVVEQIERSERYDVVHCREVEHDAETHQLRVIGDGAAVAAARLARKGAHYELLLRSRGIAAAEHPEP